MTLNIPLRTMQMPKGGKPPVRLMGFDYGDRLFHVLAFNFGDDGGAIGIWREGDNFCARISLDALAEFWQGARYDAVATNIQCGRPGKRLCNGGPECWCKHGEPSEMAMEAKARAIYDQWSDQPGWVPWVESGNSHRQDDARRIAVADYENHTNPAKSPQNPAPTEEG